MKIQREVKIGFTLIAAITILIWGFNFLKGHNVFDTGERFYGVYSRVDGLNEGSPIYYKGYKIGSVQDIVLHSELDGKFLVAFSITKDISFSSNTMAQIYSMDLMGSKGVQFLPGNDSNRLQPGDTLNTNVMGDLKDQVSMEMLPLKDKTERLLVKLDTVLTDIGQVFSEENKQSLSYSIKKFQMFMDNLESASGKMNASFERDGAIGHSLANLDSLSMALKMQRENLETTFGNLAAFSGQLKTLHLDTLAGRIDSGLVNINYLLERTSRGEGSLGLLLSDDALYLNLMDASANLDRLMADIRHNPGKYLHFSAIDLAPKMFVEVDEQKARDHGIVFKLQVMHSAVALEIKNQMVNNTYRIFEDYDGKSYLYTIGETSSYREILKIKDQVAQEFPEARVIALENGKPVKLKRALKKATAKK